MRWSFKWGVGMMEVMDTVHTNDKIHLTFAVAKLQCCDKYITAGGLTFIRQFLAW